MQNWTSMDDLCRLCGSDNGIRVNIFEPDSEYVRKIHKILPITINEHDPLPKTMCHRCSFKVNEFFEFRTNCIKAQESLKSNLPWLRDKQTNMMTWEPPMVVVALNSVNCVSPNEKRLSRGHHNFIDESEPTIIIDDDDDGDTSIPSRDGSCTSNPQSVQSSQKLIMTIKRSDIKKKPKQKSIWTTRSRKRKRNKKSPQRECKITEVFTPTISDVDENQDINDSESDPLGISPSDLAEKTGGHSYSAKKKDIATYRVENGVLKEETPSENISLPPYILKTNIPRVGFVYTCELCGRTFLSIQPATTHVCALKPTHQDDKQEIEEHNKTSNGEELYSCSHCNKSFLRRSQLIAHEKTHFQVSSDSDETFKPFNRRKKHSRQKQKPKTQPLSNDTSITVIDIDETETEIARHSLLSSDSD